MRKILLNICVFVMACLAVAAQAGPATKPTGAQGSLKGTPAAASDVDTGEVLAPFPSKIRVGLKGEGIVVSWEDSKDVEGSYIIYRFTEEISDDTIASALKVGEVPSGTRSFLDKPPDSKPYFYCVLAKDNDGFVYQVIIPFKNATMTGISCILPASEAKKDEYAEITGLKAEVSSDSIVVSYSASAKNRSLILYRSTAPVTGTIGLTDATLVSIFVDSDGKFQDYPVPGVDYYYVLIDESNLRTGNIAIKKGANSTEQPARIPPGDFRIGLPRISPISRDVPLPYLVLSSTVSQGSSFSSRPMELPQTKTLSTETAKAVDQLTTLSGWKEAPIPPVYVFPEDTALAGSVGEEYTLRSIIADQFAKKNWAEAVDRFSKYLSIHRTAQTAARAQFYLGEAFAETGNLRDAVFAFLISENEYAPQTRAWIEYLLRKLQ
jgi:hypothetical protein